MRLLNLVSLLVVSFAFNVAYAQGGDNYQELPINLVADQGEYDANKGIATYTGNVVVTQGEMNLTGDKMVIHINEGEVTVIETWGNLATFHYVPEAEPPIDGRGRYMKYTVATSVVDIDKEAYVKQEKNETNADHLTYNLKQEQVSGKRVQMILFPKSSE